MIYLKDLNRSESTQIAYTVNNDKIEKVAIKRIPNDVLENMKNIPKMREPEHDLLCYNLTNRNNVPLFYQQKRLYKTYRSAKLAKHDMRRNPSQYFKNELLKRSDKEKVLGLAAYIIATADDNKENTGSWGIDADVYEALQALKTY